MQYVNRRRVSPPQSLQAEYVKDEGEKMLSFLQLIPEQQAQTRPPRMAAHSRNGELFAKLEQLFRGRCAFCEETSSSLTVSTFRPQGHASPQINLSDSHLYYSWLAGSWQNQYLICNECNKHSRNYFPVQGKRAPVPSAQAFRDFLESRDGLWPEWPPKERNLLLDPCETKTMYTHFAVEAQGKLVPLSLQGYETIRTYGLNRERLVMVRAGHFAHYLDAMVDAITHHSSTLLKRYFQFAELEFGGSWYLLLRRIAAKLGTRKGAMPYLSSARIERVFLPLLRQEQGYLWFREAVDALWLDEIVPYSKVDKVELADAPIDTLKSVEFRHFKSLENLTLTLPQAAAERPDSDKQEAAAVLVLGENATGKSSILEGIALAMTTQAARDKLALNWRGYVLNPRLMGGEPEDDSATAQVKITSSLGNSRRLTIASGAPRIDSEGIFNVGPVFAYGAFRHYQHKQRAFSPDLAVRNLFDGSVLSNPERWLLKLSDARFDMVVRALREILAVEGEFAVVKRDNQTQECSIVTAINGYGGVSTPTETPLNVVSSGFRSVLAMVCDIMRGLMDARVNPGFDGLETARGVVLIDEVEAHLHPRWKMQIMNGLRRALPHLTFIVTTHDPLCLRGMYDGEVQVLQRITSHDVAVNSAYPTVVQVLTELPGVETMRVEQLLTSDFFQLYSTETPEINRQMANVADLLTKNELNSEEKAVVAHFQQDIAEAMPVGTSEAHRLVQEAVAIYLKRRRDSSADRIKALRDATRNEILDILQKVMQ